MQTFICSGDHRSLSVAVLFYNDLLWDLEKDMLILLCLLHGRRCGYKQNILSVTSVSLKNNIIINNPCICIYFNVVMFLSKIPCYNSPLKYNSALCISYISIWRIQVMSQSYYEGVPQHGT